MDRRDLPPAWILWTAAAVLAAWALYSLRPVLAPVFFAFLIAYMLDPLVDRIEDRGFLRGAAVGVLLGAAFVVGGVALLVLVPIVVEDVADFVRRLPVLVQELRTEWEPRLAEYGLVVPSSVQQAVEELHLDLEGVFDRAVKPVSMAIGWVLGGTASALGAAFGALMIPVFAFYLLYDFDVIVAKAGALVPPRFREQVFSVFRDIDEVLGQFFRGQITVMAVLAVLYSVGYSIAGVPLAIPIGIVAGLLSFIPYVGAAIAVGLALFTSALDFQGWWQIVAVVAAYGVIQMLEGFVITPKVMGDKVGLSALAVLFALMVGGELLGFTGVLLAVPAAAVAKILIGRMLEVYRQSALFESEEGVG